VKGAYTAFVAVLVPYYLSIYGPANFLWICDIALLLTVAALWLGSRLLASMQLVAVLLPSFVWLALMMFVYPLCVYLPTHLVVRQVFRKAPSHRAVGRSPKRHIKA
jgi:hypothetical protein